MRNGFGLRLLHRFLGLPFLRLQRETLLSQLQRNQRDAQTCSADLTAFLQSADADYGRFTEQLSQRRRQIADANPKSLSHSGSTTSVSSAASASASAATFDPHRIPSGPKSIVVGGGKPIVVPGQLNVTNAVGDQRQQRAGVASNAHHSVSTAQAAQQQPAASSSMQSTVGFMSSLMGGSAATDAARIDIGQLRMNAKPTTTTAVIDVDEFCPDGGNGLDRGFLDDDVTAGLANVNATANESDSDDADTVNPLVARFHDEPAATATTTQTSINSPDRAETLPLQRTNPLAKTSSSRSDRTTRTTTTTGRKSSGSSCLTGDDVDDASDDMKAMRFADSGKCNDEDDGGVGGVGAMSALQRRSPDGLEDPAPMSSMQSVVGGAAPNDPPSSESIEDVEDVREKVGFSDSFVDIF